MSKEAIKYITATLAAFGPDEAISMTKETWSKLREAIKTLAEQPAQQEPVAWMHWLHGPVRLFFNKDEAQMELERLNREYPVDVGSRKMRPLVFGDTSSPTLSLAQRKPLTDEQIEPIAIDVLGYGALCKEDMKLFTQTVRAIEVAHGIKGDA